MPEIRVGLGIVILDILGLTQSKLPRAVLRALARSFDQPQQITVGVASKTPVPCATGDGDISLDGSLAPERTDLITVNEVTTLDDLDLAKLSGGTDAGPLDDLEVSGRSPLRSGDDRPSPSSDADLIADLAGADDIGTVALDDLDVCCQLRETATSPYAMPLRKKGALKFAIALPPAVQLKLSGRVTRTAKVMTPSVVNNCPARCKSDTMVVPVSVDFAGKFRFEGSFVSLKIPTAAELKAQRANEGVLDFGPEIGPRGTLTQGAVMQGGKRTPFKRISFKFSATFEDGRVIRVLFDCTRAKYLGFAPLVGSDGLLPGTSGVPGGLAGAPLAQSAQKCVGALFVFGLTVEDEQRNDLSVDIELGFAQGFTTILRAKLPAGETSFDFIDPLTGNPLKTPFSVFNGPFAEDCNKPDFPLTAAVKRTGDPQMPPNVDLTIRAVDCKKEQQERAEDLKIPFGKLELILSVSLFAQCQAVPNDDLLGA